MPTPPSRSSRSAGAHSSRLAAIAKALSRSRSLAWWIAADNVHRAAARDRAEAHRDRGGVGRATRRRRRARPSTRRPRSARRSSPCPGPAGRRRRRRGSCRTDRCAPSRLRTARRRCPRHSSRCRGRGSGPPARASRWRLRNASTPPTASSAFCQRGGIVAAVVDDRLAVAVRDAERDTASRRRGSCCAGALRPARGRAAPPPGPSAAPSRKRFRPAGAAIGRVRHLVGRRDMRLDREMLRSCRARADARRCCTTTPTPSGFQAPQSTMKSSRSARMRPSSSKPISSVVDLVARMAGAQQMLAPVLDPSHRAAEPRARNGNSRSSG